MDRTLFDALAALPYVEFRELLAEVNVARGFPPIAEPAGRFCVRTEGMLEQSEVDVAVRALMAVDYCDDLRAISRVNGDYLSDWLTYADAHIRCERLNAAAGKHVFRVDPEHRQEREIYGR